MARVPTARDVPQVSAPSGTGRARRVARSVTSASGIGTGLQDVGAALTGLATFFEAEREKAFDENRAVATNEAIIDLPLAYSRVVDDLKNEAEPGAPGFSEAVRQRLEETQQTFLQDVQTRFDLRPQDLKNIEQRAANLAKPVLLGALTFERGERQRQALADIAPKVDALALSVRRNPVPGQLDTALVRGLGMLDNLKSILGPGQEEAEELELRRKLHTAIIEGGIDREPGAMLESLKAGQFDHLTEQGVTADKIEELTKKADLAHQRVEAERERDRKKQQAALRAQVNDGLKDDIESIRRTGESAGQVSNDDIRAAYEDDPGRAERIIQDLEDEKAFYVTLQSVALTPLSEDLATLRANQPEGEGFAVEAARQDLLVKAIDQKRKALAKDPLGYALSVGLVDEVTDISSFSADALSARGRQADLVAEQYGVPVPFLRDAEQDALLGLINTGDPDQAVALLGSIGTLDHDRQRQIADEIAPKSPEIGRAIQFASQDDGLDNATLLLEGYQLGQNPDTKILKPSKDRLTGVVQTTFGDIGAGNARAFASFVATTEAIYMGLARQQGKVDVDDGLLSQAAALAAGGLRGPDGVRGGTMEIAGRKTLPPALGVTESEFIDLLSALSPEDLQAYSADGKPPVFTDGTRLTPEMLTAGRFGLTNPSGIFNSDPFYFEPVGQGRYLVQTQAGTYVQTIDGPYVIDLGRAWRDGRGQED